MATPAPDLSVTHKVYLILIALMIILMPFYLFGRDPVEHISNNPYAVTHNPKVEGGAPQLADYVLATLMALVVLDFGISFLPRMAFAISIFFAFTLYVTIVNAYWSAQLNDLSLIKNSLFYIFNVSALMTVMILYSHIRDMLLQVIMHSVAASIFLQIALAPFAQVESWFRQPLFFTNENQLGYFALLSATVFALGAKQFRTRRWYQTCFYMAVTYLAVISLSKAAMVGLSLLYFLLLLQRPLSALWLAVILALPLAPTFLPDVLEKLEKRITTSDDDDSAEARGYDRIWNHPEYLFFGAGEGAYYRFNTQLQSELHSSFGTILFSYGLIGAALFSLGIWSICRGSRLDAVVLLVPVFLYGVAHQGLRLRLLWILLSFLACWTPRSQPDSSKDQAAAASQESLDQGADNPLATTH